MLAVEQVGTRPLDGAWLFRWRLTNLTGEEIEILSAWLPHSRFRSEEFAVALTAPAGGRVEFDSEVACDGEPGTVIENAFLILRLDSGRAFARLRVTIGEDDTPLAVCEAVT
jgi:hypothetical protein